jgi:hypothetical protein
MDKKINLAQELRTKLTNGTVHFAYRKKTGELRIAHGTINLDSIPEESHPKGSGSKSGSEAYYDLNVSGWRSYNPLCVVWVEHVGHESLSDEEYGAIFKYSFEHA